MTRAPPFLDDFLPYRLSYTSNLVSEQIARAYQSLFGLTIPEWRLIAVTAEEGETTQQKICARTRMDKVTVSRAAIALTDRALLARGANPDDKRSHLLFLTATGKALYADIAPKAREMDVEIFSCLSPKDRAELARLLRTVDRHITDPESVAP
jgi:DNA-binding MarR family transcriptional regulator